MIQEDTGITVSDLIFDLSGSRCEMLFPSVRIDLMQKTTRRKTVATEQPMCENVLMHFNNFWDRKFDIKITKCIKNHQMEKKIHLKKRNPLKHYELRNGDRLIVVSPNSKKEDTEPQAKVIQF